MINTMLTKSDIQYLLTQQEKLDNDIREKKGINLDEWKYDLNDKHIIALRVEIHEFINECFDSWKYWKSKEINKERILDEAVDVIHFVMLNLNKSNAESEDIHETLNEHIGVLKELQDNNKDMIKSVSLLKFLSTSDDLIVILATLLFILENYGFTSKDIIDQYNEKNKINFERLNSGY